MPKLLHSSEKVGCGAEVRLDSGELCLVSVAQSGVIVRSYRGDSLSRMVFGRLFGSILFKESNVYEAAKVAMILAAQCTDSTGLLEFRNPVLGAFVNAIWNCSSATQVCVVLNEAKSNAPKTDASDVGLLLWAHQQSMNCKPVKKLQIASYDVIYSDGKTQAWDLTQDEIPSWAEGSNNMFEKDGLPYRICRIVSKDGAVVWPADPEGPTRILG